MQSTSSQPDSNAVMQEDLRAVGSLVSEEVGVMGFRGAEDLHHTR